MSSGGEFLARWRSAGQTVRPWQVHVAGLVVVTGFLLSQARRLWWTGDDWDFLLRRGLFFHGDTGLLVPHTDHWSTVPILVFRLLYTIFGLHHYLPYAAVVIGLHLLIVHLLWRLALRLGADPWVVTAVVLGFSVGGAGADDVLWDFQITWTMCVALGLAALLVGDRPPATRVGPFRVGAVWILLVLSLMCAGIGVSMVILTALAALLRRRPVLAVVYASVPAVVFALWYERYGHRAVAANTYGVTRSNATQLPTYTWTGLAHSVESFLGIPGTGPTLLLALLVALALALKAEPQRLVPAAATMGTAVVFFAIAGTGRVGLGVSESTAGRYAYIAAALMVIPICAVLPRTGWAPLVLAAVLVVDGVASVVAYTDQRQVPQKSERSTVLTAAQLLAKGETFAVPNPDPTVDPDITTSELAGVVRRGEISLGAPQSPQALDAGRARFEIAGSVAGGPVANLPALVPATAAAEGIRADSCGVVQVRTGGVLEFEAPSGGQASFTVPVKATAQMSARFDGRAPVAVAPLALTPGSPTRLIVTAKRAVVSIQLPPGPARVCLGPV